MATAFNQQAECLLSPQNQHTVSEQFEGDAFKDTSRNTVISLAYIHRIFMHYNFGLYIHLFLIRLMGVIIPISSDISLKINALNMEI